MKEYPPSRETLIDIFIDDWFQGQALRAGVISVKEVIEEIEDFATMTNDDLRDRITTSLSRDDDAEELLLCTEVTIQAALDKRLEERQ